MLLKSKDFSEADKAALDRCKITYSDGRIVSLRDFAYTMLYHQLMELWIDEILSEIKIPKP